MEPFLSTSPRSLSSFSWSIVIRLLRSAKLKLPKRFNDESLAQPIRFNLPKVILPLMIFGCFRVSDMVAKGIVQLSTGPQKCVLKRQEKRRKIKQLVFHKLFVFTCVCIYINMNWMRGWYLCTIETTYLEKKRERGKRDERKNGDMYEEIRGF